GAGGWPGGWGWGQSGGRGGGVAPAVPDAGAAAAEASLAPWSARRSWGGRRPALRVRRNRRSRPRPARAVPAATADRGALPARRLGAVGGRPGERGAAPGWGHHACGVPRP